MKVALLHMTWIWGELLGRPGKAVPEAEGVIGGARVAERLPGLVAALGEGFDRTIIALDHGQGHRIEVDRSHDERHVRWPDSAWKLLRPTVAALGLQIIEPPTYPAGTWAPLGDEPLMLGGKRAGARDVIGTIAAWWSQERGAPDCATCGAEAVGLYEAPERARCATHGGLGAPVRLGGDLLRIVSGRTSLAGLVDDRSHIELLRSWQHDEFGWTWGLCGEKGMATELGYDPRLVADVKALESLPSIGHDTAVALVAGGKLRGQTYQGHGSAAVVVEMAAACSADTKLPGTTAPQMVALRAAAERGGRGIHRALAIHGLRPVPIDVGALLGAQEVRSDGVRDQGDVGGERGRPIRDPHDGHVGDEGGHAVASGDAREGGAGHQGAEEDVAPAITFCALCGVEIQPGERHACIDDDARQGTGVVAQGDAFHDGREAGHMPGADLPPQLPTATPSPTTPHTKEPAMSEQPTSTREIDQTYEEPRAAAPLAQRPQEQAAIVRREPQAAMQPAAPPPARAPGPRTSDGTDIIFRELACAQLEFADVKKTREAVIQKGATRYTYMYANLADVTAAVMPALKAHNIVPMQIPMGDRVYVRLVHGPSGQWIEGGLPLVLPDHGADVQRLGSALTYVRRYLLCMLLGIVAGDEDDDGASATPPARGRAA